MRIAHVNMFYLPTFGGVERVMVELAERQAKEGHEVHVFCCDSDKNIRLKNKEEIINRVHVHRLPYLFRLSLSTFIWPSLFWKFGHYGKFDIVHTHVSGHAYILITGILSKIKKFKHIHTTHCPWTDSSFRPFILRPFLFFNNLIFNRISFSLIDKIISITPWERDILKKYTEEGKIRIIPNGTHKIFFNKIIKNDFKKKHKIKEKKLVLFFGRLNPTKGPEMLARVAIELTKKGKAKDIFFLWVGPDEGKAEQVENLILPYKNMAYIGSLSEKKEIAEMYQSADVYVMPSYREGLPLTLFEAMASGLPIVASPVNGIPYEMKEPENGLFADYGDIDKIQENILKILNNSKLARTMSFNNLKKARNFYWDIIYKKYMNEYKILLKEKWR